MIYILLTFYYINNKELIQGLNKMEIKNKNHQYLTQNESTYACEYHIIWCTKYRRAVLDNDIQLRLKELILEYQKLQDYKIREISIFEDHLHLLVSINPQSSVQQVVTRIKSYTSKMLRKEFPMLKSRLPCLWTRNKFIATCGNIMLEPMKEYLESQKGK